MRAFNNAIKNNNIIIVIKNDERLEFLFFTHAIMLFHLFCKIVLEFNFADASRKWLVPLEDNDAENDNACERLPSPVPVPKVIFLFIAWI